LLSPISAIFTFVRWKLFETPTTLLPEFQYRRNTRAQWSWSRPSDAAGPLRTEANPIPPVLHDGDLSAEAECFGDAYAAVAATPATSITATSLFNIDALLYGSSFDLDARLRPRFVSKRRSGATLAREAPERKG
jgi:hypothetical protein